MTDTLDRIPQRRSYLAALLAVISVLMATFLITSTYKVLSQAYDESAHLACGMEWLSLGTFDYEALHPPLARAATAIFPYLAGAHSQHQPTMLGEGNMLLHLNHQYWHNLALSRLGILPFFWLVCLLVYRFMAERFGPWHGAASVFLLATCPPVLAHFGLATTDAPLVAMFTWSVLRFWRFLEKPTLANGLLAGLVFGLGTITKFTEIPFFLLAAFLLLAAATVRTRRFPLPLPALALGALVVPLVIWAGYRFSFSPIFTPHSMSPSATVKLQQSSARTRQILTQTNVPASQFFRGLIMAKGTGSEGRLSYLLGHTYEGGKLDFFPVALAVKTPLPMLALFFAGLALVCFSARLRANPVMLVFVAGVLGPLVVGMAGQMNIGLRHVLPVYPFVAMLGVVGLCELWSLEGKGRVAMRAALALLLGWQLVGCWRAAPEFLAYFNEIAAGDPEHYLLNSDLDWGQDMGQLDRLLHEDHVQELSFAYFGDKDATLEDFPKVHMVMQHAPPPTTGWFAVSDGQILSYPEDYTALKGDPYVMAGKSIRLYHLAPSGN